MIESLAVYSGAAAGLATSALWTATSLFFTAAGRRLGPTVVNIIRIWFAVLLLGITHRLLSGQWIPDALAGQVVFLALSGVIGLTIGDQALFTAFVDIGPRMALLIMTLSPLLAALLGWIVLGETLGATAWLGMAMTIGGVGWVVAERQPTARIGQTARRARGILLALIGAVCQAGGLLLSKQGMGHGWLDKSQHMNPQAATFVRMAFAALGTLPIAAYYIYRARARGRSLRHPRGRPSPWRSGLLFTGCGAVVGPFLGVWMSLVASDRAPLGVAQTLCSLGPIIILPCVWIIHKESIGIRAIVGAVMAVSGAALLFFQT